MSSSEQPGRAKRGRSATAAPQTRKRKAQPGASPRTPVSAERRHAMIAESAYLRAAARGFSGGDPVADWLESEREVDALLSSARH
jgi:hypothetical protein